MGRGGQSADTVARAQWVIQVGKNPEASCAEKGFGNFLCGRIWPVIYSNNGVLTKSGCEGGEHHKIRVGGDSGVQTGAGGGKQEQQGDCPEGGTGRCCRRGHRLGTGLRRCRHRTVDAAGAGREGGREEGK